VTPAANIGYIVRMMLTALLLWLVELLETQQKPLAEEAQMLEQRRRYVDSKIAFWKAVKSGSKEEIEAARKRTFAIAQELKLPKVLSNEEVNSSVVS
jgi:hypothetical protein